MKRLLSVVFIRFSFIGVTVEQSYGSRLIIMIDQMPKIGPGFTLFHYESLLSKVYCKDTRD